MPQGSTYFAECQNMLVLKLVGTMRAGPQSPLSLFTQSYMKKKNYQSLLVDMSQTRYIDSTHLGILAAIAGEFRKKGGRNATCVLASPAAMEAIKLIHLDVLFTLIPADSLGVNRLSEIVPEKQEAMPLETVLDAHRTLSEIAPENKLKFRNVIEVCADQLGKKAGGR
jgi:anti-anti-sigma regulatory factor